MAEASHGGAVGEDYRLAGREPGQIEARAEAAQHRQAAEVAGGGAGEVAGRERQGELAEVEDGALGGGGGQVASSGDGGVAAEGGQAVGVVEQVGGGARQAERQAKGAAGQGDEGGQADADGDLAGRAETVPPVAEGVQRAGQPRERPGGKRRPDLTGQHRREQESGC